MLKQVLATRVGRGVDKAVLLFMAIRADKDGTAAPTWRELEDGLEFDRKSIMGAIPRLRSLGLLTDTGRRSGVTGRVVVYQINLKATCEIAADRTISVKSGRHTNAALTLVPPTIGPQKDPFNTSVVGPIEGEASGPLPDLLPASRSTGNPSFLLKEDSNLYILPTSVPTENPIQTTDARDTQTADLLFIHPPMPVSSNGAGGTNAIAAQKEKRTSRRSPELPIPPEWKPDAAGIAFAKARGCDPDRELIKFKLYHQEHDNRRRSWAASWQKWCVNQEEWRKRDEPVQRAVGAPYVMSTLRTNL